MKCTIAFLLFISWHSVLYAQPGPSLPVKIYIVRHAEKEFGIDPVLTAAGRKRAGDLMRRLKNENIQAIFVTQYLRTQMTADSMRMLLHIDTLHYLADTVCNGLLNKITDHHFSKAILIIGHSNTIPKIIRKLGVSNYPQANIPDNEFDNLFLLRYKNHHVRMKKIKYGSLSQASAAMQ